LDQPSSRDSFHSFFLYEGQNECSNSFRLAASFPAKYPML